MSQAALTAKYRPQRFADVAGQETIKGILSRAAAQDRVAPAYLFSGTRGVGKTTVARILAKAVNCLQGPAAEPCNECSHCRQITQGMAVDVIEIDGASNRGIDDARRIREDIGYAPMECRYKVFIIDEAHMLTKEASNALLKTLEEPPGNVTFILATTEPHKILPTIVSRCQHYSFKRLTQPGLVAHLEKVLLSENAEFDPRALQLIARRAAGSVRDSMSMLGQALALGRERLEVEDVRSILGLAGSDVFFRVLEAVRGQDPLAINDLLRELLDQGLDLGFFLRELAQTWRNLFLLNQTGDKALPLLELTEEEGAQWLEWAGAFSLPHIHAAWQLTLEGQRRVLTSLEPSLALELLLLNLAFLPSLIPLEQLGTPASGTASGPASGSTLGSSGARGVPSARRSAAPERPGPLPPPENASPRATAPASATGREPRSRPVQETPRAGQEPASEPGPGGGDEPEPPAASISPSSSSSPTWPGFLDYAEQAAKQDGHEAGRLRQVGGQHDPEKNRVQIKCLGTAQRDMITQGDYGAWLVRLLKAYFGEQVTWEVMAPENNTNTKQSYKELFLQEPLVKTLQEEFGARFLQAGAARSSKS